VASDSRTNGNGGGGAASLPLFYRRPRPLNAELDGSKSLKALPDFRYAASTNSVAINNVEFTLAMRSYPIVFTPAEPRSAVAVLGLTDGDNLFIGGDGAWQPDCYIPAYVRRYPFILMEQPGSSELIVCVDEEAGLLEDGAARPLFVEGKPSEALRQAMEFCRAFHAENQATLAFTRALAEQGLLVRNEARVTLRNGRQLTLGGFEVIDEAKFNALPDAVFLDWRRRGWLHLVYCQLLSMANWSRLVDLEAKRGAAPSA